jgi:hypothetical protein
MSDKLLLLLSFLALMLVYLLINVIADKITFWGGKD